MIVNFADIVESNGKTVRKNNFETEHDIPIGTLVEIDCDYVEQWHGCRLFVVDHQRDCDGTPLYGLGKRGETNHYLMFCNGWSKDSLVVVSKPSDDTEQVVEPT